MEPSIKLIIASPDLNARLRYADQLQELGFSRVQETGTGDGLLNSLCGLPDIIFLDQDLGGAEMENLVARIYKTLPEAIIVLLLNRQNEPVPEPIGNMVFDHFVKGRHDQWLLKDVMGRYMASRNFSVRVKKPCMPNNAFMRLIADAQEEVRKNISAELHDNVNQLLGASKLYIESARVDEEHRNELLMESKSFIENAINEIRKISHHLSAAPGTKTFSESLAELFGFLSRQPQFRFEQDVDAGMLASCLSQEQQHHVLRILQELANNAIKYSGATVIRLTANISADQLELTISDNGYGFSQEQAGDTGIGLNNVQLRVQKMNGSCRLVTAPEQGCAWNIVIPIDAQLGNARFKPAV